MKKPSLNYEKELWQKGFKNVAGLDEAGRGSLAGPLVAAAVILPKNKKLYCLRDSKLLDDKNREKLSQKIKKEAKIFSLGMVENIEIEKLGLQKAGLLAFKKALSKLKKKPDFVLIDFYRIPDLQIPQKPIKKGDMVCASIASASILAKVYRDNLMKRLSKKYPGYFFEENKGYGTKKHLLALKRLGACPLHRKNFAPVKELLRSI